MRIPVLNRLLLPGSSGDFPPILHQYTSAIWPDDEARAIHWITFYAYYALCALPRDAWLPTQPSDSGDPQPHLPEVLTGIIAQEAYKAQ